MKCENCGKEHNGVFGSGRFCSRACANARKHSEETKEKLRNTFRERKMKAPSEQAHLKAAEAIHNAWLKRKAKAHHKPLDVTNEFIEQYRKEHPVCEMCGLPCSTGRRLALDHDHKTNKFRGLLCMKCNRHLGWYESNKEMVDNYLGSHVPR